MSEPIPENAFYFVVDGRAYVGVQLSLDTEVILERPDVIAVRKWLGPYDKRPSPAETESYFGFG